MSNLPLPMSGPSPACPCTAGGAGAPGRADTAGRFGATHALILLIAVLCLGSALFLAGTPLRIVFTLLGGLGLIGAGTLTAAGGVRRAVTAVAEAIVRASGSGRS
ncbi:hypothetical protein [[Kitasatospora] papulosa]|uniref:hypothetical protein n=1 Tax=[Kitasatospora] papulosa TaxID=1464011 RepID=UPI0036B679AE